MERFHVTPIGSMGRSEAVLEQLTGLIFTRRLRKGDRLPTEAELCDMFKVGRGSIREALRMLEGVGIIERTPNGTYLDGDSHHSIARILSYWVFLNDASLEDVFEIRALFEETAASLAAERATEADIRTLEAIHDQLERSLHDREKYVELNVKFHLAVAQSSKNLLIGMFAGSLQIVLENVQSRAAQSHTVVESAVRHHENILLAIKARDSAAAREWMRRHLQEVRASLVEREGQTGTARPPGQGA